MLRMKRFPFVILCTALVFTQGCAEADDPFGSTPTETEAEIEAETDPEHTSSTQNEPAPTQEQQTEDTSDDRFDPHLLLVHLPNAFNVRDNKGRTPADFTGWTKDTRGDGAFRLAKVVDGVRNGPMVEFYNPKDPMSACHYVDGKMHGLHRFWDREGNLTETIYDKGELVQQ